MFIDKSKIKKILVITLTNIGDVILTFPVIDILKEDFPATDLSVVVSPKSVELLKTNKHLKNVYVFDKKQSILRTIQFVSQLRREHYDLIVDLRNTAIAFFAFPRYRTNFFVKKDDRSHMKEQHLNRLHSVYPYNSGSQRKWALFIPSSDREYADQLLPKSVKNKKIVCVAPGAAYHKKRWSEKSFAEVCDHLINACQLEVAFVGDKKDREVAERILTMMGEKASNICGETSLIQLAVLINKCFFMITNDSAPMHLASYLDKPVLSIFGPSSPVKYGPWSKYCHYLSATKEPRGVDPQDFKNVDINKITSQDVIQSIHISNEDVSFQ